MRYRIGPDGAALPVTSSADFVELTVWFTLACGVLLFVLGLRGRQLWLRFWGALTCLCCALYFARSWLGLQLG